MTHFIHALPDLSATESLAQKLALLAKQGDIIALEGTLGAGKTAFARAFIHARGIKGEVPSPTFTLLQTYDTPEGLIHHFDLYRLKSVKELEELGFDDACSDGIVIVEWPEHAEGRLPEDILTLEFGMNENGVRYCEMDAGASWNERLGKTL